MKRTIICLITGVASLNLGLQAAAQDDTDLQPVEQGETYSENEIVIDPLFEYIEAPDNLPDLRSRTDYVMDHFWDPFDFKQTDAVDQNALNHAFWVYTQSMPFASEKKVTDSVKKLIGNIKGNPGLTYQFTKAAEENLYGPRASFWADDIYISFLENLLANKKIGEKRKQNFKEQLALLKATSVGSALPAISLYSMDTGPNGLNPGGKMKLVEFIVPGCDEERYSHLKMDISSLVNDMIDDGRLEVVVTYLGKDYSSKTAQEMNLPAKWRAGYSPDAIEKLDIRLLPSYYILDPKGVIVAKNLTIDDAIEVLYGID